MELQKHSKVHFLGRGEYNRGARPSAAPTAALQDLATNPSAWELGSRAVRLAGVGPASTRSGRPPSLRRRGLSSAVGRGGAARGRGLTPGSAVQSPPGLAGRDHPEGPGRRRRGQSP